MTITTEASQQTFLGNGVQTVFNFGFVMGDPSYAVLTTVAAGGAVSILNSGQYTLSINPPLPGAIWGVGGSILYPNTGSPLPLGASLTVQRVVPELQTVSLSNQGSQTPQSMEMGLDLLEMQIQETTTDSGYAFTAPLTDPTPPLPAPPASVRANQGAIFDGSGNLTAGALPASGVISAAMQPVVDAASILLGQTAFGLLGQGLVSSSGQVRVQLLPYQLTTNLTVTAAHYLYKFYAANSITLTLSQSSTLFNGFGFWVNAFGFGTNILLQPHAGDAIDYAGAGIPITIQYGCAAYVYTNGAGQWYVDHDDGPINLLRYGADQTGTVDSSSAITLWLAAGLASNQPLYMPTGEYLDVPRTIDLANVAASGILIFGDGADASQITIVGNGGWSLICTGNAGNQAYCEFANFGIQGSNTAGPILKVGSDDYSDAFNDNSFRNMRIVNTASVAGTPVTMTITSPCVVSWTAHGLAAGAMVSFTTTGELPTGLTPGTPYFVLAAGLGANSFEIASAPGGSAINTSGSQSGSQVGVKGWTPCGVHFNEAYSNIIDNCVWDADGSVSSPNYSYASGAAGLRMTQSSFNRINGSFSGAGAGIHMTYNGQATTGYSFGNVFEACDFEVNWFDFQCDSANAGANTFLGSQFEFTAGGSTFNCTAGVDNNVYNPNATVSFGNGGLNYVGVHVKDDSAALGVSITFPLTTVPIVNTFGIDLQMTLTGTITEISLTEPGGGPISFTPGTHNGMITIPWYAGWSLTFSYSGGTPAYFIGPL